MKPQTVIRSIMVALGMSGLAFMFCALAPFILGSFCSVRGLVALLGCAYLFFLFSQAKMKLGKVVLTAVFILITGGALFFGISTYLFLGLVIGVLWLTRSLYRYSSFVCAFIDLGTCVLSLAASCVTYTLGGGIIASVWVFFLAQCLVAFVPAGFIGREQRLEEGEGNGERRNSGDDFMKAYRVAEGVLGRG